LSIGGNEGGVIERDTAADSSIGVNELDIDEEEESTTVDTQNEELKETGFEMINVTVSCD
jgi:hypothetical protein